MLYTRIFSFPFLVALVFFIKNENRYIKSFVLLREGLRVLIISPFLVKLPVFGLHFWLPKAHVEARTSGSIVLAGVLLKLGSLGLLKIYRLVTLKLNYFRLMVLGLATISRAFTCINSDIKKIIAYRSVTHITLILVGVCLETNTLILIIFLLSISHG
jgi:NADH:ubiquinone oxidoreductase subunit 4 (subunit M)